MKGKPGESYSLIRSVFEELKCGIYLNDEQIIGKKPCRINLNHKFFMLVLMY